MENDEKCLSLNGGGSRTLCPFLPSSPSSSHLLRPLARRRSVPRRAMPCDAYSLYRAVLDNAPEPRRSTERWPRASSIFARTRNSSSRASNDDATTEARIDVRQTFRRAVPLARSRVASIQLAVLAVDLYGRRRGRFTVNIAR